MKKFDVIVCTRQCLDDLKKELEIEKPEVKSFDLTGYPIYTGKPYEIKKIIKDLKSKGLKVLLLNSLDLKLYDTSINYLKSDFNNFTIKSFWGNL